MVGSTPSGKQFRKEYAAQKFANFQVKASFPMVTKLNLTVQKRSPLWNTLFKFDSKIRNTHSGVLETTSILALWQNLRTQEHYFHFRPFNQLDIM